MKAGAVLGALIALACMTSASATMRIWASLRPVAWSLSRRRPGERLPDVFRAAR